MTRTGQLSIVLLDVEPPYELVSEYRAGRGMQDDRKGLGMGLIKEDEKGMSPLVLTCRKLLDEVLTYFEEKTGGGP